MIIFSSVSRAEFYYIKYSLVEVDVIIGIYGTNEPAGQALETYYLSSDLAYWLMIKVTIN
jgi:hypothetical protein